MTKHNMNADQIIRIARARANRTVSDVVAQAIEGRRRCSTMAPNSGKRSD